MMQYLDPACVQILYEYVTIIASQGIDLRLLEISTGLRRKPGSTFLDVSDSVFGLEIGSVYRTIGKIIRSDLPFLKLCDGLTSVTGGRMYMSVGFTERNHLNGEYSESFYSGSAAFH